MSQPRHIIRANLVTLRLVHVCFDVQAQDIAQEMYRRMFAMKFLPPGRGLWAMGSKLTTERRLFAALNNCAFVSTEGKKLSISIWGKLRRTASLWECQPFLSSFLQEAWLLLVILFVRTLLYAPDVPLKSFKPRG